MKKLFLFLLVFPLYSLFYSRQDSASHSGDNKESFAELPDTSVIKKEIALFTIAGAKYRDSTVKLVNIPLFSCSDSFAYFEKGDWISTEKRVYINTAPFDTTGHKLLYTDGKLTQIDGKPFWGTNGEIPKRKINCVMVVYGEYWDFSLPVEAFSDLYEPVTCTGYVKKGWRKPKSVSSVKAYRSVDNKRTYIYMKNAGYEVTWVISWKTVIRRVVDEVE